MDETLLSIPEDLAARLKAVFPPEYWPIIDAVLSVAGTIGPDEAKALIARALSEPDAAIEAINAKLTDQQISDEFAAACQAVGDNTAANAAKVQAVRSALISALTAVLVAFL